MCTYPVQPICTFSCTSMFFINIYYSQYTVLHILSHCTSYSFYFIICSLFHSHLYLYIYSLVLCFIVLLLMLFLFYYYFIFFALSIERTCPDLHFTTDYTLLCMWQIIKKLEPLKGQASCCSFRAFTCSSAPMCLHSVIDMLSPHPENTSQQFWCLQSNHMNKQNVNYRLCGDETWRASNSSEQRHGPLIQQTFCAIITGFPLTAKHGILQHIARFLPLFICFFPDLGCALNGHNY